jgi:hypothetical protein
VSTIRTAQAFGTQNILASLYDVAVQKAYVADCQGAVAQGFGLASFFFFLYAAYGLGEFCALLFRRTYSFLCTHAQRSALGPPLLMRAMLLLARL